MDPEKRRTLTVVYATKAIKQLGEIWDWNEQHYSLDHAERYIQYLERHIDTLSDGYEQGKPISSRPDLRYILIRRKSRGHGHVAVYKIKQEQVRVLYVFHSARDWQAKLAEEPEDSA
jgi:plasmid stabilization system protein ParE